MTTATPERHTVRVLSLVENTAEKPGLLGEHGLAMWLEVADRRVLFDTGQGSALLHNARELGVDLSRAEAIVLSHGHYDHTGGLSAALARGTQARLYAHPAVFRQRFAKERAGLACDIGIRSADLDAAHRQNVEFIATDKPTEVIDGLFVTGPVPRATEFEDTGGPFFLDAAGNEADPIVDDQALFFGTERGTAVLLGCAHAGVVNTLSYVRTLTGGKPIHCVIGGMHLWSASRARLERTIEALQQMHLACLRPAHCTGARAVTALRTAFPNECGAWSVGTELTFGLAQQDLREQNTTGDL